MPEFVPEAQSDAELLRLERQALPAPQASRQLVLVLKWAQRVLLARPERQWKLRVWLVHLSGVVLEPRAAFPWLVQC